MVLSIGIGYWLRPRARAGLEEVDDGPGCRCPELGVFEEEDAEESGD